MPYKPGDLDFSTRWRYQGADPSIKLFDYAVHQRWFDGFKSLPPDAHVLELGSNESDFAFYLKRACPEGLTIGVDYTTPVPATAHDVFIQADASRIPPGFSALRERSLDAVLLLGSLEHFGLGYYGDPVDEAADVRCLSSIHSLVKVGGFIYFDVPWTPYAHYVTENRHFRVYSDLTADALVHACGPRARLEHEAWATGENPPPGLLDERPTRPLSPFWYNVRMVRV